MFDLTTVWLLICLALIIQFFWQFRRFAETAERHAREYCKRHQLQFLSVPRKSWQLSFNNGFKLEMIYTLNYSADGLSAKKGEVIISNGKVTQVSHWS